MADIADMAQERIDAESAARMKCLQQVDRSSLSECQDCGDDIPPQRQATGGVTRCIDCQSYHEVKNR